MNVLAYHRPTPTAIPGVEHTTLACCDNGLEQLSIWRQTLAVGAETPLHSHDCDEVVICHAGCGELHTNGTVQRFGADATIVLPKGQLHRLRNAGPGLLETTGILAATPVMTRLADGSPLDLPWRS